MSSRKTGADSSEGVVALDSSLGTSFGPTGVSAGGIGVAGAADAASAWGSYVGSACACHETDDISDILDVGLGEEMMSDVVQFCPRTVASYAPFLVGNQWSAALFRCVDPHYVTAGRSIRN